MITTESHENFTVSDSGLHINPKWPFMGASPDGLVDCNCCSKGICEIKCPYSLRYATMTDALGSKAFCLEECDTTLTLKKSMHIIIKCKCNCLSRMQIIVILLFGH